MTTDLKYAYRMLRKNPGFTAIVVLVLAVGIGANTVMYSAINSFMRMGTLSCEAPDRIVALKEQGQPWENQEALISPQTLGDWQQRCHSFEAMVFVQNTDLPLQINGRSSTVKVWRWGPDVFKVIKLGLALGRPFAPDEHVPGPDKVAIVSHGFWVSHFGGREEILGQSIGLGQAFYTIIGVLPPDVGVFDFQKAVWLPLSAQARVSDPGWRKTQVLTRLKDKVSLSQAQAEVSAIAKSMIPTSLSAQNTWTVNADNLQQRYHRFFRLAYLLQIPVCLVLLIACSNVAGLILARGSTRKKELAMRMALGAPRQRIVRQLLVESVLLALLGGVLGFCFIQGGMHLVNVFNAPGVESLAGLIRVDTCVSIFTVAVSLLAGLACGQMPALQTSKLDLSQSLRISDSYLMEGKAGSRFLGGLVVTEIAVSLMLLISTGLMIRSVLCMQDVDLGFDTANRVIASMTLANPEYEQASSRRSIIQRIQEQAQTLPGVQALAVSQSGPHLGGTGIQVRVPGQSESGDNKYAVSPQIRLINATYFSALGIPIQQGHSVTDVDHQRTRSIVINEALAKRHWPGQTALGQHLEIVGKGSDPYVVTGIVRNTKNIELTVEESPTVYLSLLENPPHTLSLVFHTKNNAAQLAPALRTLLKRIQPDLTAHKIEALDEAITGSNILQGLSSLIATLLGILSVIALFLATVGIYGIMAYATSQRTHEIGIRVALGAHRGHILIMVMKRGIKLTLIGLGIGIVAGLGMAKLLTKLLYGVSPADPVTLMCVCSLLTTVALMACYLPARRAANTDPMVALRFR